MYGSQLSAGTWRKHNLGDFILARAIRLCEQPHVIIRAAIYGPVCVLQRAQYFLHLYRLTRFEIIHAAQSRLRFEWHLLEQIVISWRRALELDRLAATMLQVGTHTIVECDLNAG